jgi:drug/metabolite transporter (DMT)-like permease
MWVRIAWLLFGIFTCSTAVIFIKMSTVHPLLLAGYRQVMAALILMPLFLRDVRHYRDRYGLTHIWRAAAPAFMLASHFASWTLGARRTSAANATLIVNLVPVVMPFLMFFVTKEGVNRSEVAGTMVAIAGLLILTVGDVTFSVEHVSGDVTCFLSMLLFAVYLSLARRNRDFPSIWTYVVPLYFMGGVMCFAAAATVTQVLQIFPPKEYLYLAALAMIPTVFGHSILNYSLKHMRGQLVSICNLAQFIFAGAMAFFIFAEIPRWNFYLASVLIVLGSVVAIRSFQEA